MQTIFTPRLVQASEDIKTALKSVDSNTEAVSYLKVMRLARLTAEATKLAKKIADSGRISFWDTYKAIRLRRKVWKLDMPDSYQTWTLSRALGKVEETSKYGKKANLLENVRVGFIAAGCFLAYIWVLYNAFNAVG